METYIKLSTLNDFVFCPKSIYYHEIYDSYNKNLYQEKTQKEGTIAHTKIDNKNYSTSKHILQWLEVYSGHYWIAWKIDIFNTKTWELIERKNKIHKDKEWQGKIYLWYKYQLWWQMYCLEEMGYETTSLYFYSMQDNKKYRVYKPLSKQLLDFEDMLEKYKKFDLLQKKTGNKIPKNV